jgi:hypothetical protein
MILDAKFWRKKKLVATSACRFQIIGRVVDRWFEGVPRWDNQRRVVIQLSFGLASVLPVEALNTSGGIHELLFAGEEGMTARANLESDLGFGGARLPGFAAGAMHRSVLVFGMNIGFHCLTAPVTNHLVKRTSNISGQPEAVSRSGRFTGSA